MRRSGLCIVCEAWDEKALRLCLRARSVRRCFKFHVSYMNGQVPKGASAPAS